RVGRRRKGRRGDGVGDEEDGGDSAERNHSFVRAKFKSARPSGIVLISAKGRRYAAGLFGTRQTMSTACVTGLLWGDEGKGKIIDLLAEDADYVVRYGGGHNAGH